MRRLWQLAILLLVTAGAIWIWTLVFPGPEKKIRARMDEFRERVSFRASDGNLAALADLQQFGKLFTEDAQVRVDSTGMPKLALDGRDSIVQAAGGARQVAGDLDVEFLDVVVTLAEDERSAVVDVTGKARQQGSDELWVQVLRFQFTLTEDGWLISSVATVRMLSLDEVRGAMMRHRPGAA